MVQTAEQKKRIYAEKKARAEKGLLTPKELVQREKGRVYSRAWSAANPEYSMARYTDYNAEVPFMLLSSTSRHCLNQRSKKRQRVTLNPESGRSSVQDAISVTQMMNLTPKANLLPEMQAMFDIMQYEIDAMMVEIARMVSAKEQTRALHDMKRKKDVPSTVAPMWRVVKCTEEGTFFSSIWQDSLLVQVKSRLSILQR